MTGRDVINRAREDILQDIDPGTTTTSDTNLRIKDEEALRWLNDGIIQVLRLRPDSLSEDAISSTEPSDITTIDTTLRIGDRFRGVLADYCAYRFLNKDEQDRQNIERAKNHKLRYLEALA